MTEYVVMAKEKDNHWHKLRKFDTEREAREYARQLVVNCIVVKVWEQMEDRT